MELYSGDLVCTWCYFNLENTLRGLDQMRSIYLFINFSHSMNSKRSIWVPILYQVFLILYENRAQQASKFVNKIQPRPERQLSR